MEEMYILHELQGPELSNEEIIHDNIPEEIFEECPEEVQEEIQEEHYEVPHEELHEEFHEDTVVEPLPEHNLPFEPIEEPGPNWEMELAQAYVRHQPLEGVFPPEESLKMGTVFPNLSNLQWGRPQ